MLGIRKMLQINDEEAFAKVDDEKEVEEKNPKQGSAWKALAERNGKVREALEKNLAKAAFTNVDDEKEVEQAFTKLEKTIEGNIKEGKEKKIIPHFDYYLNDEYNLEKALRRIEISNENIKKYCPRLISLSKKHLQFLYDVVEYFY